MKLKLSTFFGFAMGLFALVPNAFATSGVIARVTGAGTNADGSVFVTFDRPIMNCGAKAINRIDIANEHPAKNQVLLIGMTVLSTFGSAKVSIPSCQNGVPHFTTDKAYLQLTSEKATPLNK